jgi:hypothetical protein
MITNMKNLRTIRITLIMVLSVITLAGSAQVTIGEDAPPKEFSVLELISNKKMGLRMPLLTTAERNDMTNSAEFQTYKGTLAKGLTIFNTTTDCLEFWNGTKWISKCTGAADPSCNLPDFILSSSSVTPAVADQGDEAIYTASISNYGPALSYKWTITNATVDEGGSQTDNYVKVTYSTSGNVSVSVEVDNNCGVASHTQNVTVTACAAPTAGSVSPSTETAVSATTNTNFTLGAVSVSYTSGSPATKYQWYRNTTKSTTGATLLTGKTANSLTTQESTAGTYYYYCEMTNAECTTSSVQTGFYIVTACAAPVAGSVSPSTE